MASLPYPLSWLYNHGRVGMAGMPYPPIDCRSYIKINVNTYLILSLHYVTPNLIAQNPHYIYCLYEIL